MSRTPSETYFEKLCSELFIRLKRIPEACNKTPDYELTIDGQTIIAEVKEITRNKEEQESDRVLKERGYGNVSSITPGHRIRKKISESSPQIKARSKGIYPGLLVLFDHGLVARHLDPYCIRAAMCGLEEIYFTVPTDPTIPAYATDVSFGPKRKMTKEHNTSISAIGVLFATGPDEFFLHVYHNNYATVPLKPTLLIKYGIRQFRLGDEAPTTTAQWQEIALSKTCTEQEHTADAQQKAPR